jgi:hypothetical protein
MAKAQKNKDVRPDRRPITEMQAKRLAAVSDVRVKEVKGLSIAEIDEKFRYRIDPELLCLRRICGRVVKTDPDTGEEFPVPFATVHVEDTDCGLLGFFPTGWPWGWFFPLFCQREEIATVVTDECGRFCVYVPCWEVDWILRWRRERICFPEIFIRPNIRDILEELLPEPPIFRPPRPEPDPVPWLLKDGGQALRRAEELIGRELAGELATLQSEAALGASTKLQQNVLNKAAFSRSLPPPLPSEVRQMCEKQDFKALATHLSIDQQFIKQLEPQRFIGPFRRCVDIVIPEWLQVSDVPDITFRVTQDVDGDGDEETIYSESFFDVRWDSGPIPDVTLEASPIAVAGITCETPDIPCEDTPAIQFVGLMPLINPPAPDDPYHDAATGYARRPNRPHPSGSIAPLASDFPLPLAEAPYTRVLQLYGCNEVDGAAFYRLTYQFNGGPVVPFTGLTWPLYRVVGGNLQTLWPTPDANGWYPVIPATDDWFPDRLLLNWPTGGYSNGLYTVVLEVGNAAKSVINSSSPVNFRIDNSRPSVQFTELRWRVSGGIWSDPLPLICPVVPRPVVGGNPENIEFQVSYQVNATHLRSVSLNGGGCGGGTPNLISPLNTAQHWHTSPGDNSVTSTATFALPGTALQGAYSFRIDAISSAFNPSGGDGGLGADWNYNPVYRWTRPFLPVAVVNT